MLRSTTNKSFLQKRHAFIEYETKIMQNIYDKLKTYFPTEIRRIIWQLTIENHNSIYYNDIVVSSDNPRNCEEIYFRFQGGYKPLFELTYKGVPNNTENPYAYMGSGNMTSHHSFLAETSKASQKTIVSR